MTETVKKIVVCEIRTPVTADDTEIFSLAEERALSCGYFDAFASPAIHKRSIDARHRDHLTFSSAVTATVRVTKPLPDEKELNRFGIRIMSDCDLKFDPPGKTPDAPPVVVGFGPAGIFCAYALASAGLNPVILERGGSIEERVASVERFLATGELDPDSNVQFGAGGAGTFSDGKLTTRIHDPNCAYVLKVLHEMGAPDDILTRAKPHVGTDRLRAVITNLEKKIRSLGGEIRYHSRVTAFDDETVTVNGEKIPYSSLTLAIGHSARDLYAFMLGEGYAVEAKPFSVGVRAEHLQAELDRAFYGKYAGDARLGHAEYALSYRKNDRGVYSFCMCPGGEVIASSSEQGGLVVNGMSRYARDGRNANAAIAVQVDRRDYGNTPERAIAFQRDIERKAFVAAGGDYYAPVETLGDFYAGKAIHEPKRILPTYRNGKVRVCDLHSVLPSFVCDYLKTGFAEFGKKIRGFSAADVPLTGVETRTSAPVRLLRGETGAALGHPNIYPCGEGAGYAGGIVSAATDGLFIARQILNRLS